VDERLGHRRVAVNQDRRSVTREGRRHVDRVVAEREVGALTREVVPGAADRLGELLTVPVGPLTGHSLSAFAVGMASETMPRLLM